jgi:XTP/dITP diphosphohydrolase
VTEVVLATRSVGKLRELAPMLRAAGYEPRGLDEVGVAVSVAEDTIEVFESFAENARAKARYFAARCGGRDVLAEDSGLVVPALGGAPGVRSRRWSGSDLSGEALDAANNAMLVSRLAAVEDRRAWYECAAVWVRGTREWCVSGRCEGRIVRDPRGGGGFGYDPWFFSDDLGMTFGEATAEAKAGVSHRGRAIRELLAVVAGR